MSHSPRLPFTALSGVLLFSMLLSLPAESRAQNFEENIGLARAALEAYDFTEAARYLAAARKKIRTDEPTDRPVIEMYERQMALAKNYIR
ncbi:MAG: hypothetical protein K2J70_04890, partial [Muribaculaceae bacterium]|nr:hypothetical protein [Muribaculaceae bacterium]